MQFRGNFQGSPPTTCILRAFSLPLASPGLAVVLCYQAAQFSPPTLLGSGITSESGPGSTQ